MTVPPSAVATTDADALAAELDELAGLAARVTGMPIAVITRTEGGEAWVIAETGLPERRGEPVMTSFVREASGEGVHWVADMATDPRFADLGIG